jgi:hypothetical protein
MTEPSPSGKRVISLGIDDRKFGGDSIPIAIPIPIAFWKKPPGRLFRRSGSVTDRILNERSDGTKNQTPGESLEIGIAIGIGIEKKRRESNIGVS